MVQRGKNVTLYLDRDLISRFKEYCRARGTPMTQAFNDFMRREVAGATGQILEAPVDSGALERDHLKLAKEVDELERWLKKRKVHTDLEALARRVKLKADMSNLDAITPQLLEEWNRDPKHIAEDMHIFITLLRKVHHKKGIESQLEAIRTGRA